MAAAALMLLTFMDVHLLYSGSSPEQLFTLWSLTLETTLGIHQICQRMKWMHGKRYLLQQAGIQEDVSSPHRMVTFS
jgi:hypothetical protein